VLGKDGTANGTADEGETAAITAKVTKNKSTMKVKDVGQRLMLGFRVNKSI
jgi:hypothetical protein